MEFLVLVTIDLWSEYVVYVVSCLCPDAVSAEGRVAEKDVDDLFVLLL